MCQNHIAIIAKSYQNHIKAQSKAYQNHIKTMTTVWGFPWWSDEDVISCPAPHDSPPHPSAKLQDLWREQGGFIEGLVRLDYKTRSVHTGAIDSIWTQMRESIPSSLSSKSPQISTRIRSFQWRFTHAEDSNLLKACGHELSEAWQNGEKRKYATAHVWFGKTCGKRERL
jgi:hypothetical protein